MEESSNVLIQFGFIPFIITEVQWVFFFFSKLSVGSVRLPYELIFSWWMLERCIAEFVSNLVGLIPVFL